MKIYQVGGAVRDGLRGQKPEDFDYVVVGSTPEQMLESGFRRVGKDFPVFLHPDTGEEYALARKEIKTGNGHRDFRFVFGPEVTLEEDLIRRDFTCNAIARDPETGEYIDPFNGREDIKHHILRHVNGEHFQEDPLRILRLCRFAAQLDFSPAEETLALVRRMTAAGMLAHLTPERIWKELEKALRFPGFPRFLETARQTGALQAVLPEVDRLWATPERTDHHPEKNSGAHTLLALKQAADASALVRFGILLHDIGKTMTPAEILPSHYLHEQNGLPLIDGICRRLKVPNRWCSFAKTVCRLHMKFCKIPEMRPGTLVDFCEDLMQSGCNIDDYIAVCRADMLGRAVTVGDEEKKLFNQNADTLHRTAAILADIRATDMPRFAELPKDGHFGELYREFRIRRVQTLRLFRCRRFCPSVKSPAETEHNPIIRFGVFLMIGVKTHVGLQLKAHILVELPVMIKRKPVFSGIGLEACRIAFAINGVGIVVAPDRQIETRLAFIYAQRRGKLQTDDIRPVVLPVRVKGKAVAHQPTGLHQVGSKTAGIRPPLIPGAAQIKVLQRRPGQHQAGVIGAGITDVKTKRCPHKARRWPR